MADSDFTLPKVKQELGLTVIEGTSLFSTIQPIAPSALLRQFLDAYSNLATLINTEKSRSEFLIAPILADLKQVSPDVSLFSGTAFNVDAERGLVGYCDYILSRSPEQIDVTAPVMTIVEAKNESVVGGLGQCIASMVGAQIFNERSAIASNTIYGAVTNGTNWRFLKLIGLQVWIDNREYFISELDRLLGILSLPFQDPATRETTEGQGAIAP